MEWIAAFTLGFLGSLHCVGMCGPLALAVPAYSGAPRWVAIAVYHLGRLTTYSVLGALLGGVGFAFSWAGGQQILSVILGAVILLTLFLPRVLHQLVPFSATQRLGGLKRQLQQQLKRRGALAGYLVGALNGLLPCGLVYMALSGAMATYKPILGAGFMASFGLGTLPLMLGMATLVARLRPQGQVWLRRLTPYLVGLIGFLLIARGLDLGIPYLSPQLPETVQAEITTCQP